mmetsp:Transcript_30162/g.74861  ORF Transcript_30162/g.74861 Transcript_30162/m.74861 type:complete len:319 (-) Transcript_30162:662-1618(-)
MSSGLSPPGMPLSPWQAVTSASLTGLKCLMSSSGTAYSLTYWYRSRVRMRLTMSRARCIAGSSDHSMRLRMVSSSLMKSFTSQMALLIWLSHTMSASVNASTTMYSTALAALCVYTIWCKLARVWNSSYTLYTSLALKQISSPITFMNDTSREMSTLAFTPQLCASRIRYSNLSTSTELRLLATMSHRNFFPRGTPASSLVMSFFTVRVTSASRSRLLSSTIHANMSADMASWFHGGFLASQLGTRRGRNSLSNTWLKGPCPRSWHRPASWTEVMSLRSRTFLTPFPLVRVRASYTLVARWAVPRECSKRLWAAPGNT